jgi:TonB family protein
MTTLIRLLAGVLLVGWTMSASAQSDAAHEAEKATWQRQLKQHLTGHIRGADDIIAKAMETVKADGGAHRSTMVVVRLDRNGRIVSERVKLSSGYSTLDDAAVAVVRSAGPLPAPPASMPDSELLFTVPIAFNAPPRARTSAVVVPDEAWKVAVLAHLNRRFNETGLFRGALGTMALRFVLDRQGNVLSCTVVKGSGHEAFDDMVTRLGTASGPYPPFPQSMHMRRVSFVTTLNAHSGGTFVH